MVGSDSERLDRGDYSLALSGLWCGATSLSRDITQRTRLTDWLARQAAKEAHEGGGWGLRASQLRRVRV